MTYTRRRFLALSGASLAGLSWPAMARETQTLGGRAFGSYWRISLAAPTDIAPVRRRIEAVIATVDLGMSPYLALSEIARFNAVQSNDWVPVSAQTHVVIDAALRIADESAGSFDPTVGPIVGRYGFGPITGSRNSSYLQLALMPDAIRKHDAELSLDLCGIAKGFALDQMAAELDAQGIDDYMIELGGEVFARGHHPKGRAWQVAIEQREVGRASLGHLVALNGNAIATSGTSINAYDNGARRYSHLIDPRIGAPINDPVISVSVLSQSGMRADGLATALMVMGLKNGAAFAQDHAIDALFLAKDGSALKTVTTGRFAESLLI